LFFAPIPIKLKNKDRFSKIVITTRAKLQPILFATVNNFLTSKEGDEYLIAMQENNSHWSCEKVLKNKLDQTKVLAKSSALLYTLVATSKEEGL